MKMRTSDTSVNGISHRGSGRRVATGACGGAASIASADGAAASAIGVLMVRHQCPEGEAFDAMRKYSQDNNIRLADVAERVVLTGALGG